MTAGRLLVGVGQTSKRDEPRRYLLELLSGLAAIGVHTQVAVLSDGPARRELQGVADVRVMAPPRPRAPAGLAESLVRRVDPGRAEDVHDWRTRSHRRWIQQSDCIHLNGPQAAPLLRYVKALDVPVTTYVHPHDFHITGLQPGDRERLLSRTLRFLVADERTGEDLIANGVDRGRIELTPDPLIFPSLPPADSLLSAARSALNLPAGIFVVGVPPVPDWIDAPDLTLALAWELQRRRGAKAPHLVWYAMPDDDARRWPVEYDIERMGLANVRVVKALPRSIDPFDLVDAIVLPSHTTQPVPDLFVTWAAAHGTPVLCWDGHPLADDVRGWTGGVVAQPDVEAMADEVLRLAEDTTYRRQKERKGRRSIVAELERIVPSVIPTP